MAGGAPPRKTEPAAEAVDEAIATEVAIAEEAEAIREEASIEAEPFMDRALFVRLLPLLRRPIPKGFLIVTTAGEGKPFPSTGIRSVQVQINRMDNVLTPLWWSYRSEYEEDGKVCHVVVAVHGTDGEALVTRDAYGGVNRGSTQGNLRKGSFTNAAKQAFARMGPGSEVYVGTTDHDPDVDPDAAVTQTREPATNREHAKEQDVDAELKLLLAKADALTAKRANADQGMQVLGAGPAQRLRELKSAATEGALDELVARVHAAADAIAAG